MWGKMCIFLEFVILYLLNLPYYVDYYAYRTWYHYKPFSVFFLTMIGQVFWMQFSIRLTLHLLALISWNSSYYALNISHQILSCIGGHYLLDLSFLYVVSECFHINSWQNKLIKMENLVFIINSFFSCLLLPPWAKPSLGFGLHPENYERKPQMLMQTLMEEFAEYCIYFSTRTGRFIVFL